MAGRRLIDLHLNGGTYNLGHRNRELIATLEQAMEQLRHRQPPLPGARAHRARRGARRRPCPPNMRRVIYGSGGGEAIDIAIKTARHTRQRRKIVSIRKGYHGHTGLAVAAGDERFSDALPLRPARRVRAGAVQRPGRDGGRAARRRRRRRADRDDPRDLRLPAARARLPARRSSALCERYGALYIADEVQTGLMRTGEMWCIQKAGDRARHHGRRQGHHRRHVPDRLRAS